MVETEIISEAKMRDEHEQLKSVIFLSSSSEEEEDAREDPILEIVDRSRNCEAERRDEEDLEEIEGKRFRSPVVIDLSSSSSDEVEIVADWRISANAVDAAAETKKKKKKNKMKINEQRDVRHQKLFVSFLFVLNDSEAHFFFFPPLLLLLLNLKEV